MYYAKIENGEYKGRVNISDEVPDITFTTDPTAEQLAPYGVVLVQSPPTLPEYDPTTHGLNEITPTLGDDGIWYANYEVLELAPVEPLPTPEV
jgi:hypothetical protein